MRIIQDGTIKIQKKNGETITITGKDVIDLMKVTTSFTNFIETNSIGKGDELNV